MAVALYDDTADNPAEDTTPGTPGGWLALLLKQLDARQDRIARYDDYYRGKHRLAFSSEKFRAAFGGLFSAFADNFCPIVVDSAVERLCVEGFRLGAESDESGDDDAWGIWQANELDADSEVAFTEALIAEESYMTVWWADRDGVPPRIDVEHPSQVIVAYVAGSRSQRAAALKRWMDDDEYLNVTLYLPDAIYKFRSAGKVPKTALTLVGPNGRALSSPALRWLPRETNSEAWPLPNKLGVVPVVPLCNRRRLLGGGESEIAGVIPINDAINKLCADMIVASEFAAFRQRWATGVDIPKDPATGQPVQPWKAAIDRVWTANPALDEDGQVIGPEPKFGEFGVTDLGVYAAAIDTLVQHLSSITATPAHYFNGFKGQFPSGESVRSAESGLVSKVRRKQRHFGEALEEVMRLAFMVKGDDAKAAVTDSEVLWASPETMIESTHVDSIVKQKALGIPDEFLWALLGHSPQAIARIKKLRAVEPAVAQAEPVPTETIAIRG